MHQAKRRGVRRGEGTHALNRPLCKLLRTMFIKEFYETGLRDKVFLAEEYRPWELILMYVPTDSSHVLVQNLGDLAGCVEVKVGGHLMRFSTGIPVIREMRRTVFDPLNLLFLFRMNEAYCSVIPNRLASSLCVFIPSLVMYSLRELTVCLCLKNFKLNILFNNIVINKQKSTINLK